MYPLDFEEFCWAFGEDMLVSYIKKCFDELKPLEDDFHHKAMLLFKQYMLIGGMPKSVAAYLENNRSFVAADAEKRDILTLYRNDIGKADVKYRSRISSIFEQIPAFLSLHEKRVRLSNVASNASYPMYQDKFFWLGNSMMTNECFNCNDPNVGLSLNEDRTFINVIWGTRDYLSATLLPKRRLPRVSFTNKYFTIIFLSMKECYLKTLLRNVLLQTVTSCFSIRITVKKSIGTILR